jgi:hypothetical protein
MPKPFCARGVNTTLAPSMRINLRRSIEKLSAMVTTRGYPLAAHTMARPMAGAAAGRLDHRLAGLQITGALSLFNDLYRKPIFHRRQRVEMLSLDVGPNAIRCQIINAGARRIADGVQDTIVELAAAIGRSSIILSRHYFSLFLSADPCRHANTSKG